MTSGNRRIRVGALVLSFLGWSVVDVLFFVLPGPLDGFRYRGRRGGSRAPPDCRPYPATNARTRSAVRSVGERPASNRRTRCGSPNAILPNLVGLRPVLSRNALSRDPKYSSSVSMTERCRPERKPVNLWTIAHSPGTFHDVSQRLPPPKRRRQRLGKLPPRRPGERPRWGGWQSCLPCGRRRAACESRPPSRTALDQAGERVPVSVAGQQLAQRGHLGSARTAAHGVTDSFWPECCGRRADPPLSMRRIALTVGVDARQRRSSVPAVGWLAHARSR